MRTTTRSLTAAAVTVILGFGGPALAQADDPNGYGDGYQSGAYGRIRSADDGATIIRGDSERGESDRASINAPIFPGDTLRTDGDQRVEVQLAGGATVRIDTRGEVVFQSLPNPSATFKDNTVIALNAGTIRIDARSGEKDEFRIDTRAASAYLLGEGEFRIATDELGGMRVASLRGVAEVVGNDGSVLVRGGTGTSVLAGAAPDAPRAYIASASDGFDRWCDSRDDTYRVSDRNAAPDGEPTDVPEEVRPYSAELSIHGSWTVVPEYGTVWYPTGVASDWRPYSNGYWSYGPGGYFWVSYEPWGWAPYHYGSWQWVPVNGWCWIPGRIFAGAWVSWSWGSLYVGWAPLDYWGRPGWIGGPYYAGYYDPGCWTFVNYDHIYARNVHRYAVPIGTVRDDLRHATVVARAPSVDPRRVAQSPVERERAKRLVADDHDARMRPIQADRRPERSLAEMQERVNRRSPGAASARVSKDAAATPSTGRRVVAPRSRQILQDPRAGNPSAGRPETRNDVRDLYQRMSRPRETRSQDATVPRNETPSYRRQAPRETPGNVKPDVSRAQTPRAQAPRAQAPRTGSPQAQAPRAQAPRAQAPRAQAPRQQPSRPQSAPQARPKHGDRH